MLRTFFRLGFASLLLAVLLGGSMVWYCTQPLSLRQPAVDFEIARGESMKQIAYTVADAGVDVSPLVLTWLARLSGHSLHIKAGSYRVEGELTAWDLVSLLSSGANRYSDLTFVEGWSFAKLRQEIDAQADIEHVLAGLSEAQVMARLGGPERPAEGQFAPDTYSYVHGSSDLEILRRAYERMQSILDAEWSRRAASLPLRTPYEALILASVVEKETGLAQDRDRIAAVFINRLRIGMPLQSDPTVIYGMGAEFKGNLHKHDLQTDTPFNSYTRGGLPPTPIAMPSQAALHAVLHPAPENYLYFVARGDGSSEFSRTLEEHNRAVARYQRMAKH